jgi:hypothetical protein
MAFAPVFDTLAVFRASEVILVRSFLLPAALTLGFALLAAARLGAVALMPEIAVIGMKEFFAAEALALGLTLHGGLKKIEPPLLQNSALEAHQNQGGRNKTETFRTKRIKVLFEPDRGRKRRKSTLPIRFSDR